VQSLEVTARGSSFGDAGAGGLNGMGLSCTPRALEEELGRLEGLGRGGGGDPDVVALVLVLAAVLVVLPLLLGGNMPGGGGGDNTSRLSGAKLRLPLLGRCFSLFLGKPSAASHCTRGESEEWCEDEDDDDDDVNMPAEERGSSLLKMHWKGLPWEICRRLLLWRWWSSSSSYTSSSSSSASQAVPVDRLEEER
jgi:hypothetical protein